MPDVLLIHPYVLFRHAPRLAAYRPYPPLGLMVLGAVLRRAGYDVEILDGTFEDDPERILERLKKGPKPRVAGVYALAAFRDIALASIDLLKELGVAVIAGGPDPTLHDATYLSGGADVVIRGEGEGTLLAVLHASGLEPRASGPPRRPADEVLLQIPGVSILDDEVSHRRAPEPVDVPEDLDELPSPAYDLVDLDRYLGEWRRVHGYASLQLMTSRRTPFSSAWPARPAPPAPYRQHRVERVVAEVEWLVNVRRVDHLWLFDDSFAARREWVEAFADALIARRLCVRWSCVARPELVDRRLLERMRDAGCERIFLLGLKRGAASLAREVARDMHELGIGVGGRIRFGQPGELWADIEEKIAMVCAMAPIDHSISLARPLAGAEVAGLVEDAGQSGDCAEEDDAARPGADPPFSPGFYRMVISLLHTEYDHVIEATPERWVKAKLLRAALGVTRALEEGHARVERLLAAHLAERPGDAEGTPAAPAGADGEVPIDPTAELARGPEPVLPGA